jgi:hypothetical protein
LTPFTDNRVMCATEQTCIGRCWIMYGFTPLLRCLRGQKWSDDRVTHFI